MYVAKEPPCKNNRVKSWGSDFLGTSFGCNLQTSNVTTTFLSYVSFANIVEKLVNML